MTFKDVASGCPLLPENSRDNGVSLIVVFLINNHQLKGNVLYVRGDCWKATP